MVVSLSAHWNVDKELVVSDSSGSDTELRYWEKRRAAPLSYYDTASSALLIADGSKG